MAEARNYYQVKITIRDIEPDIWRRLLVPSGITFHKFHKIIQAAFDWQDYHLYLFELPDFLIKVPDFDFPLHEVEKNPKSIKIDPVFEEHRSMLYEYDYGDAWYHEIIVEDKVICTQEFHVPICLEGERHRPPEDVGGTGGYEDFLSVIGNPQNIEYDEMLEWAEKDTGGRKFDPEYFYKPEINRRLAKIKC
jgi:hypothetical protein